jgi:peptidoglycan biosynthesis protein MviN/MurJ (putative lipid II flippase)
LQDTRTPTLLNTIAVGFNIAIDIPLYGWLGVRGLALGHALTYALGATMLFVVLQRRIGGGLEVATIGRSIAATFGAAAVMGIVLGFVSRTLGGGDIALVSGSILCGVGVYLIVMKVCGEMPVLSSYTRFRRSDTTREGKGGPD